MSSWQQWWVYDFSQLFASANCWPRYGTTYAQQLNSLTRMIIIITIVLLLLRKFSWAFHFFLFSMLTLLITGLLLQRVSEEENLQLSEVGQARPIVSHIQVYQEDVQRMQFRIRNF